MGLGGRREAPASRASRSRRLEPVPGLHSLGWQGGEMLQQEASWILGQWALVTGLRVS